MRWDAFLVVVAIQIVAFQFLSGILTRTLPDYLIGRAGLPEATAARVAEFKRRAGRLRYAIGVLLLLLLALIGYLFRSDKHVRVLAMAVVSLLSSATFLLGYLHDRRTMAAMAADLPDSQRRLASLEKRSLSQYYPPAWEALPAALLLGTVGMAVFGSLNGGRGAADLWYLPILQAVTLTALLGLTFRNVRSGSCYSPRVRAFHGPPEQALALERAVLTLELRHLLACRIGLGLWTAVSEAGRYASLSNPHLGGTLTALSWILLGGILALLPIYSITASRISRRFSDPTRPPHQSTAGNGGSRS